MVWKASSHHTWAIPTENTRLDHRVNNEMITCVISVQIITSLLSFCWDLWKSTIDRHPSTKMQAANDKAKYSISTVFVNHRVKILIFLHFYFLKL